MLIVLKDLSNGAFVAQNNRLCIQKIEFNSNILKKIVLITTELEIIILIINFCILG